MLSQKEKTRIVNDCIKNLSAKPSKSIPPIILAKILSDSCFLVVKDPYAFKTQLHKHGLKYQRWFWHDYYHKAAIVLMKTPEDALLARITLSDLIIGERDLLKLVRADLANILSNVNQNETNQTV